MRAAIYARRSTEEHQAESLDTQLDGARRFIAAAGWTLDEAHVFTDSGVSRAEFAKRPGLLALLRTAESRALDVVVTRDETRLGGDMLRTGLAIQNLSEAGCKLVYYATGEEVRADDATARLVLTVRNFSAELEREKIASRTREHLERKARRGLVAGGVVFGYDNAPAPDGLGRIRVINAEQAAIVVELFERYAAGNGLRALAKLLNARGVPSPRAGKRGTSSWAPSSIGPMLRRDLYRGVLVWGRREKVYRGGTKKRIARPECGWTVVEVPELRIVSDELWTAVQGREARRARITGSKARGAKPKYMLSGLARCAECGGPMHVHSGKVGSANVRMYVCAYHRDRGACDNALRRPVESVDAALVDWIRAHVLREDIVLAVLAEVRARLEARAAGAGEQLAVLERESRQLSTEIERLALGLAQSKTKSPAIVRAIDDRQGRLEALDARLRTAKAAPSAVNLEIRRLERDAKARLRELSGLFGRQPAESRKLVESVLRGPLTFKPVETPEGKRFEVSGELALAPLFLTEGVPSGTGTVRTALLERVALVRQVSLVA